METGVSFNHRRSRRISARSLLIAALIVVLATATVFAAYRISLAKEEDCDWIWIMDDDTIVKEDSLEPFTEVKNAEMKMISINNTGETLSDVRILGRTMFEGNTSIVGNFYILMDLQEVAQE